MGLIDMIEKGAIKEAFGAVCKRFGETETDAKNLIRKFSGEAGKQLDRDFARFRKIADALAKDLEL
jgi:hypothetical protein